MACGLAPMRRSPRGASSANSGNQFSVFVKEFFGFVASHPLFELPQMFGLARQLRRAEPDASETSLRSACHPPLSVPSSLSACAERSSAICGRSVKPFSRASVLNRLDLGENRVERRRHQLMHRFGIVAFDEVRLVAVADQQTCQFFVAQSAPARSGWRFCSRSNAESAAPRRRAPGSEICSSANWPRARPVSASPSPMTQAAIKSGLSKTAP